MTVDGECAENSQPNVTQHETSTGVVHAMHRLPFEVIDYIMELSLEDEGEEEDGDVLVGSSTSMASQREDPNHSCKSAPVTPFKSEILRM